MNVSTSRYMEDKINKGLLLAKEDVTIIDSLNKSYEYNESDSKIALKHLVEGKGSTKDLSLSLKYFALDGLYRAINNEEFNFQPFFNSEIKSNFLSNYPSNTQIPYSRIFEFSKPFEESYNKDLALFKLNQIDEVLQDLQPLTKSASHVNGRIVTAYIDWAMDNLAGELRPKTNPLKELTMSYFDKFINQEANQSMYFTNRTYNTILADINNPQDLVLMQLLFVDGVEGSALSEIRNMKKSDIDYTTGRVKLLDDNGSTRTIRLSDKTIEYILRSNDTHDYLKKNGRVKDEKFGTLTRLVENNYVIRTSVTKTDFKDRPVEKMVLYRRIKTLNETLGYPFLTTKNIIRSGIIAEGKKLLEQDGVLDNEQYNKICSKFNINNVYQLKKYCNVEMIEKLYKKNRR